jgi:hypothetical protein
VYNHRKRFEQCALSKRNVVRELVAPFRWMDFVPLNSAVIRIDASESHVFAEIVPAVHTQEAGTTGDAGFEGYAVAFGMLGWSNNW